MNSPYVLGQSGTESPEPVLVTIPPAKMSPNVEKAVNLEYRLSQVSELLLFLATAELRWMPQKIITTLLPSHRPHHQLSLFQL